MSNWTIDLPWRGDPEQPLLEAMTDTRVIEDREQRAVAYELHLRRLRHRRRRDARRSGRQARAIRAGRAAAHAG